MKTKGKHLILSVLVLSLTMLVGCTEKVTPVSGEKIRNVEVSSVEMASFDEVIRYIGNITSEQMTPVILPSDGRVRSAYVKPGDFVEMGQVIGIFEDPIGQTQVDLLAPDDGYVVQLGVSEGNWGQANSVFAIIGSEGQIASFGMTQADVSRVDDSNVFRVEILAGDAVYRGELLGIDRLPDASSRTYQASVEIFSLKNFLIGEICEVKIYLDTVSGIWLPILNVQNDGQDYVYIVNDQNRIERRNLVLHELNDAFVRVDGLEVGDRVVVVGNAFVREGQEVTFKEAENE
ncbi:efflux RND transporter periplasmic adaptor subunit [Fusibacter tunisiensis]|uniref:Multidrug efflux pump subunit AcrA (Membrane-fusion protein) n=1 Tax=Fusibacter tunisiensis TaxID=1008308 RepID=A0ABS2MNR6_9FIRM|nr:hypothetical protein [Fusibacter tunisiensis]MBM7561037.1 multidrug efflux pump subunit AcrA (membrane-fusion protein) [Fusibacter tunisiensis]